MRPGENYSPNHHILTSIGHVIERSVLEQQRQFLVRRVGHFELFPHGLDELGVIEAAAEVGVDALEEDLPIFVHGPLVVPGRADLCVA